jgi:putative membrane protein
MKVRNLLILTVIAGIWTGLPLRAAESSRYLKEQKFLSALHHANQMEIEMGRMAKEKGSSEQVRAYGARLIGDRQEADRQVIALSQLDGITVLAPSTSGFFRWMVAARERSTMGDLSKKTGEEFDKAFVEAVVYQDKLDFSRLENAEYTFKQPDVRKLISNLIQLQLPDRELAEEIQSGILIRRKP